MNTNNIFERIREQLSEMAGSTQEHQRLLELLKQMEDKQVNLLVTGPTGSGKSITINSLFNMRVAEVGAGVDPQTKDIDCYKLENLVIWDTPGFGDSESADREYARQIISKLEETDKRREFAHRRGPGCSGCFFQGYGHSLSTDRGNHPSSFGLGCRAAHFGCSQSGRCSDEGKPLGLREEPAG